MTDDPLVIGATGGSGTRAVARIVQRAGWFMGTRLNRSDDSLDIADFDWQWGPEYVRSGASDGMRDAFESALAAHLERCPGPETPWGWKHPQSYLLLPFLSARFPRLRFIHVVRDGRDIALARNQNQVMLYGDIALGPGDPDDLARRIAFWAWANERASDDAAALLGERALLVRLEDLVGAPEREARRILAFAGAPGLDPLPVDEIRPPESLGRGKRAAPSDVHALEAAASGALRRFGYLDE
jgi:hypothetical protein